MNETNDTSRCPECDEPGVPQTRRNGVLTMACEEPQGCDYEDQWEHTPPTDPSAAKERQEWDQGVYGMFWCHTAYGGDDYDSMMQCALDDPKVQTVGVNVKMTPDAHPCDINFHINCDRLGMVDPKKGQEAFDKALKAARLFVAAPDLLAALTAIVEVASGEWSDKYRDENLANDMADIAREAINKTKAQGGE